MEDRQFGDGMQRAFDLLPHSNHKILLDYRLILQYPFVNDLKIVLVEKSNDQTPGKIHHLTFEEQSINPWVYRFKKEISIISGVLEITVSVGEQVHHTENIGVGVTAPTLKKEQVVSQHAPRLVLSLNSTPQGNPEFDANTIDEKIKFVLKWIDDRLQRGLDDTAWIGIDGGRGLTLEEQFKNKDEKENELWARRITEFMLGNVYAGIGDAYNFHIAEDIKQEKYSGLKAGVRGDIVYYEYASNAIAKKQQVYYPLAVMCQHSSNMALLSRGVTLRELSITPKLIGVNSGGSKGVPLYKSGGGVWHESGSEQNATGAVGATPPAAEGTVFEFYSTTKGVNKGSAHIGFVLRTHKQGWQGVQTFDVGGLHAPQRNKGVDAIAIEQTNLGGGIFDDPWTHYVYGPVEPFSGMGVLPSGKRSVGDWNNWSPLGFVRLVLKNRKDKKVIYSTPLLRMLFQDQSYSISKYAWSLRSLPFRDEIFATWEVWLPRQKLATEFLHSDRSTTAKEILSTFRDSKSGKAIPETGVLHDATHGLICGVDVISMQDGKANIKKIYDKAGPGNRYDTLPWAVRKQASGDGINISFDDVPEYLQGNEIV